MEELICKYTLNGNHYSTWRKTTDCCVHVYTIVVFDTVFGFAWEKRNLSYTIYGSPVSDEQLKYL